MAPGLVDELPIAQANNGKRVNAEQADPATAKKGKYNAIPGPLGLASASLEGKVALVTGAGKSSALFPLFFSSSLVGAQVPDVNYGPHYFWSLAPTRWFGLGLRVGKSGSAPGCSAPRPRPEVPPFSRTHIQTQLGWPSLTHT